jgi:hypothetical protein
MTMTKLDLIELLASAIQNTAKKLGISDSDWKVPEDLLKEIAEVNPKVYSLLQEYFEAYLQCYQDWTHEKISIRKNALITLLNEVNKL